MRLLHRQCEISLSKRVVVVRSAGLVQSVGLLVVLVGCSSGPRYRVVLPRLYAGYANYTVLANSGPHDSHRALTVRNIIIALDLSLRLHSVRPSLLGPSVGGYACRPQRPPTNALPAEKTIPPTWRSGSHRTICALEAAPTPGIGEREALKLFGVLFLRNCAIFGPRHGLARLVDIAGPSFGIGGGRIGFRERVGTRGRLEQFPGSFAKGHFSSCCGTAG